MCEHCGAGPECVVCGRAQAVIASSGRVVPILRDGAEFFVVHPGPWPHGRAPVSGPFAADDPRFLAAS